MGGFMRLKNKKTGEIADLEHGGLLKSDNDNHIIVYPEGALKYYAYNSLAELNAEWKDYEEPKEYWYIGDSGDVWGFSHYYLGSEIEETHREIGNLFDTREEAEQAVRKLKAWKRLKDKGLRFNRWTIPEEPKTPHIKLVIEVEMDVPDSPYDLDICFGGEE